MFHVAWIINAEKKYTGELCTPRNATKRQHLATDYSLCSLHSLYENLTGRFWTEAIRDKNSEPGCGSFSVALCHLTIVQNLPALLHFWLISISFPAVFCHISELKKPDDFTAKLLKYTDASTLFVSVSFILNNKHILLQTSELVSTKRFREETGESK